MGNDPKTSVLNANCQAHDVKNLFVADAGPFVSNAHKNCTWTILALAMRTSEYIARQRNQGTVMTLRNADLGLPTDDCGRSRRSALRDLTGAPAAAALVWTDGEAQAGARTRRRRARPGGEEGGAFKPKFFTAHEYATVGVLVDLIIPRDERSGSATDAGVPEFMDFMMIDQPRRQVAMRGGLALIDKLSQDRFGKRFLSCTGSERTQLLDEIAYTTNADDGLTHAIRFFSSFRDLTATGFWTTKMGIPGLAVSGQRVRRASGTGCPEAALKKLGVTSVAVERSG